jgi:hypothetical protein
MRVWGRGVPRSGQWSWRERLIVGQGCDCVTSAVRFPVAGRVLSGRFWRQNEAFFHAPWLKTPQQYYVNMDMTTKLMSWFCWNYWARPNFKNWRRRKLSIHRVPNDVFLPMYGSTALCWNLAAFSVSWSYTQPVRLLGRGISPSQDRYLHGINAHRHPCLELDSNTRSQRSSERKQRRISLN